MILKRIFCLMLVCVISIGSLGMEAGAVQVEAESATIERASGRFSLEVYKNEVVAADTSFPLEVGETVTINAVYSPRSASVTLSLHPAAVPTVQTGGRVPLCGHIPRNTCPGRGSRPL